LPLATVFLLLLCNDKEVLGPWVNRPWLNAVSTAIVSILVVLSLILMVTTVFPHANVVILTEWLAAALVASWLLGGGIWLLRRAPTPPRPDERRLDWRMPPVALLDRPILDGWRRMVLIGMGGYLVVSVVLLVVKAIQIG
jgi:hypothetical protein